MFDLEAYFQTSFSLEFFHFSDLPWENKAKVSIKIESITLLMTWSFVLYASKLHPFDRKNLHQIIFSVVFVNDFELLKMITQSWEFSREGK